MKEKEIFTNNMVTLDKVSPSKAILVFESGEPRGIVCKVQFDGSSEDSYKIQWVNGYTSDTLPLPVLVSSYHADGFTFKTQLSPGEPLQEIISGDNWIHINNDILHRDLVLVKKDGNIIGMVQFDNGDYFVSTSINDIEEDLRFSSTLRVLVEEGHKKGYSFHLLVNDTDQV